MYVWLVSCIMTGTICIQAISGGCSVLMSEGGNSGRKSLVTMAAYIASYKV